MFESKRVCLVVRPSNIAGKLKLQQTSTCIVTWFGLSTRRTCLQTPQGGRNIVAMDSERIATTVVTTDANPTL